MNLFIQSKYLVYSVIALQVLTAQYKVFRAPFLPISKTTRKFISRMASCPRTTWRSKSSSLSSQKSHNINSAECGGCQTIHHVNATFFSFQDVTLLRQKTSFKMVWLNPNEIPIAPIVSNYQSMIFQHFDSLICL